MNRRAFLKFSGAAAASVLFSSGCHKSAMANQVADKPNILFVLVDDMGWNDIGYHSPEIKSPNLDKLARTGVELNRHYVQPQCTPSRVALMTGRYPSRFGDHCTLASNEHSFPFETLTMASMLKKAGYKTGLFGKWHMGSLPEWGPNHHGFDFSYGSLAGGVGMLDHRYRLNDKCYCTTWHRNLEFVTEQGHATDLVTKEAIKWIEQNKDKPFFCYVPYQSVHTPLVEEEKWLEMNKHINDPSRRLMAAAVSHLDHCVRQLVETLDKNQLRENTLIVFISDNGGVTGAYRGGNWPKPNPHLGAGFSSNLPLRGGKATVYEGGIRVPAFVNWPARLTPAKNDTVSHVVDWMPTIAGLVGLDPSNPDPQWDGMDIWPYIKKHKKTKGDRVLYWVWDAGGQNRVALRKGDWKILSSGRKIRWQLYNLAEDPYEKQDLAEAMADKVKELEALFIQEQTKDKH